MLEWLESPALIVAFVLSAFNLWDRIESRIKSAKEPTKVLEGRIVKLENMLATDYEARFVRHESHFQSDLERIEQIEEGNKVTQKALLALLSHAVDGNNIEQLKKAENDLTQYLIDR